MNKTLFLSVVVSVVAMGFVPTARAGEAVSYLEPVYVREGEPKSGIDHWVTNSCAVYQTVAASEEEVTWGAPGETNWYVVADTKGVAINERITCVGDVRLILKDGAKLSANAGIVASPGTDGYLGFTVYAQSEGKAMGALLSKTFNNWDAGIGGRNNAIGSRSDADGANITINGGNVSAASTGNTQGAGIGGGQYGMGTNIVINGGSVAAGSSYGAGIGGGQYGSGTDIVINGGDILAGSEHPEGTAIGNGLECETPASGICVHGSMTVKAGSEKKTATEIAHVTGQDIASDLADKRYASVVASGYEHRLPDYTTADGRDWLYHHDVPGKRYPDSPAADPGVDVFYLFATVADTNASTTVNGCVDIDDPQIRGYLSKYAFEISGSMFGDYARVYVPYYRQVTWEKLTEVVGGKFTPDHGNERFAQFIHTNGMTYVDAAAALEHYFTVLNPRAERPFILAGYSQGAAVLRSLLEDFFTQDDVHKAYLKSLIACYMGGYGVSSAWAANLEKITKTEGFDGITVATNATQAGVLITWNTEAPGSEKPSILVPDEGAFSVNPITWTTNVVPGEVEALTNRVHNLGAMTNTYPRVIYPGLFSAVNTARGVIVCPEMPEEEWLTYEYSEGLFGTRSLHYWDFRAYWENIRENGLLRLKTLRGWLPRVGDPTDYADTNNWMTLPDDPVHPDKGVDVFYVYPTSVPDDNTDIIAEIDDAMKTNAARHYRASAAGLAPFANMYAPYYRQAWAMARTDFVVDTVEWFCTSHVPKTDIFAALDRYFTVYNPGRRRPFILAGHAQGSCLLKLAFEEYFQGPRRAYLDQMVAAYAIGWSFPKSWCAAQDVPFAAGETDTGVIITWNAEGPNAVHGPKNFLTAADDGQAINPLNWRIDDVYAARGENFGSMVTNAVGEPVRVTGDADAQLQPATRPGALIVTDTTYTGFSPDYFGDESYHLNDWPLFYDNVASNALVRARVKKATTIIPGEPTPTFDNETAATNAAAHARVLRPNADVEAVVDGDTYNGFFHVSAVPVKSDAELWTLSYALTQDVATNVQAAIDAPSALASLVETVTNERPTTIVQTYPGLYYGIAGTTNFVHSAFDTSVWTLGNGQEITVEGQKPTGATDRAFYNLRAKP